MKTETSAELQIHSITNRPSTYEVDYSIIDDNGQADVTQVISKKALTAHAADTGMNEWHNGEELVKDDLFTYMADNYELVIEDFILTHTV